MDRRIWLIRHGRTKGNIESRYVGTVDESLAEEGKAELLKLKRDVTYPAPERVYVSYMKRCKETAKLLFPDSVLHTIEGLHECDFGEFEYKSYEDLNGYPVYQDWIDSGGMAGFPGGESMDVFQDRVCGGFLKIMEMEGILSAPEGRTDISDDIVLVCHGGSIMAMLDRYSCPHKEYFDWQAGNGLGFTAFINVDEWRSGECLLKGIESIS